MKIAGQLDRYIDPGKSEEVTVTIRAGRLPGPFSRKVILSSDDPNKPSTMLVCKGTVRSAIKADPPRLTFGKVTRDSGPLTKKVIIRRGETETLDLKLLPHSMKNMQVDLKEIEPGERYELTATLSPPWPNDPIRGSLTFQTGAKECPQARLDVIMLIDPRVVVQPKQVVVAARGETAGEYRTTLRWPGESKHKVLGASINDDKLAVSVEPQGSLTSIVLTVPEDLASIAGYRVITVQTDDDQMPVLEVPVRFLGQRGGVRRVQPAAGNKAAAASRSGEATAPKGRAALQRQSLKARKARQGAMQPTTR